jgi:hypothetical protein
VGLISNTGPYNAAADNFNVQHGSQVLTGIPRSKFQFSVDMILNPTVSLVDESFGRAFTFHRVSSAGLPDYDYNVVTVNQYNRMRYIPTRMTVQPVTIIFYDTKDSQFDYLMQSYANHYYQGHQMAASNFNDSPITNENFSSGGVHLFGAKTLRDDQRFFFEEIVITQQDTAQGGRRTHLYNCMITNINHDRLDYSDSQPVQYTVQFQPEHVNIFPLGDNGSSAAQVASGGAEATTVANRSNSNNFISNAVNQAATQIINGQRFDPQQFATSQVRNFVTNKIPTSVKGFLSNFTR